MDGELNLLYSSSMDGRSDATFQERCNGTSCTLTIVDTADGLIIGGFNTMQWKGGSRETSRMPSDDIAYSAAKGSFLFVLAGTGIASPAKMKLNSQDDSCAICQSSYGPTFGLGP